MPRFRTPFDSQHNKQCEKLHRSISNILFYHFDKYIDLKNVRLSVSEIRGMFNTSTPNDKYSLRNRKNLRQLIQLQLSK